MKISFKRFFVLEAISPYKFASCMVCMFTFLIFAPDLLAVTEQGTIEGFKSSAEKIVSTIKGIVLPVVMWAGFGLGVGQMALGRMKQGTVTVGIGVIAKMAEAVIGQTYTLLI